MTRLPSRARGCTCQSTRSPGATSSITRSRGRPRSTAIFSTGTTLSSPPSKRCGGIQETTPRRVSLPHTVMGEPGRTRRSTPPHGATRTKPLSSTPVTTRPIWSRCASRRMRRRASGFPIVQTTLPMAPSARVVPYFSSSRTAVSAADSSAPDVPGAEQSRNRSLFNSSTIFSLAFFKGS